MQMEETSFIGEWWRGIDKLLLFLIGVLIFVGIVLISSASPSVAERIGIGSYSFIYKHLSFIIPSFVVILFLSLLSLRLLRIFCLLLLFFSIVGIFLTLVIGVEVKGAQRWLSIVGFSLQPSEFVKPAFALVCAWLCSSQRNLSVMDLRGLSSYGYYGVAFFLGLLIVGMLILQPDFGQSLLIITIMFSQVVMIGIPLIWLFCIIPVGFLVLVGAYFLLPHVRFRVDSFFASGVGGNNYQSQKSLEAFNSGGILGQGLGEGEIKERLPDSHTDFIFAVLGEESGFIFCIILIIIFMIIFGRTIQRASLQNNHFIILAVVALTSQLAAQTFINMGSTLNLIPTTGMTLPLISYGGSSLLAVSVSFGLLLGLTRIRAYETRSLDL